MGASMGGSQSTKTIIPENQQAAADANLARAQIAAAIGYTPYYGPDVAAFTPVQEGVFRQTADTARAFGMDAPRTNRDIRGGLPRATEYAGGVRGYSSGDLFDQSLLELERRRPAQKALIDSLFIDPVTGMMSVPEGFESLFQALTGSAPPSSGGSGGGSGGGSSDDSGTRFGGQLGDPNADSYFGESIVDFVSGGGILGGIGRALGGSSQAEQMAGMSALDRDDPIFAGGATGFMDPDGRAGYAPPSRPSFGPMPSSGSSGPMQYSMSTDGTSGIAI